MGKPMDRSNFPFLPMSFPELEAALMEYYETGEGVYERWRGNPPTTYTKPHQVTEMLMACSNPRCERGGYEIDREIHMMILGGKMTHRQLVTYCPGDEGSPKGRKKGNPCENALHVRLTLKYKSSSE